ncbi:uncharacterized protein LOC113861030 [Abrus precatorius]|uniref:Uncharacterized protein LOC113861030 n=1 Tax=Abrus precatorius TaxID=3816 RepID=A0A8B8KZL1_ABRPR|nr:uncharacterized protein LOC113861030 [Abrus precatorius]
MAIDKSLFVFVSLSSLLLSIHAMPSPHNVPYVSPLTNLNNDIDSILKEAIKVGEHIFKPEPEVLEFCRGTENPTFCAETIAPYFQSSFDPLKALEIEMKATLNQSLKVSRIIAKSISSPTTNKRALKALYLCKSQYNTILYTIKEAIDLLNQQNVVDAYYKFNLVLSKSLACEYAFLESPGVDIPFADDSFAVSQHGFKILVPNTRVFLNFVLVDFDTQMLHDFCIVQRL